MAAKENAPYWQICMTCDRREYAADPVQCRCGAGKMLDVQDHPDNAGRKQPVVTGKQPAPQPAKP